jgi:hypothetical protein
MSEIEMCSDFMGETVGIGVAFIDLGVCGLGFEVRAGVNGGRWSWEVIDG